MFYYENYHGSADKIYHEAFYERCVWRKRFLWRSRRCNLTGRLLWLCWAYEGTAIWHGPGEPIAEYKYHSVDEHTLWLLARNFQ